MQAAGCIYEMLLMLNDRVTDVIVVPVGIAVGSQMVLVSHGPRPSLARN